MSKKYEADSKPEGFWKCSGGVERQVFVRIQTYPTVRHNSVVSDWHLSNEF